MILANSDVILDVVSDSILSTARVIDTAVLVHVMTKPAAPRTRAIHWKILTSCISRHHRHFPCYVLGRFHLHTLMPVSCVLPIHWLSFSRLPRTAKPGSRKILHSPPATLAGPMLAHPENINPTISRSMILVSILNNECLIS